MLPNGKSRHAGHAGHAGHATQQLRMHTRETREAMSPTTQQSIQLNSPFWPTRILEAISLCGQATNQFDSQNQIAIEVLQTTPQTITDRLLYRCIETNLSTISCEWWKSITPVACMHGRAVPAPLVFRGRSSRGHVVHLACTWVRAAATAF